MQVQCQKYFVYILFFVRKFACRYFHHGVFNEELLALITLHGNTTAAAIYDALISKLKELQLPIQNICALSTDGAPAMIGACHGMSLLITVVCMSLQMY